MRTLARRVVSWVAGRLQWALQNSSILVNPFVSAKVIPLERRDILGGEMRFVVVRRIPVLSSDADGLPVPPIDLREGWSASDDDYLSSGQRDMAVMLEILEQAGETPARLRRVLDFGCAAGRMLRFYPRTPDSECWGVDIKAKHIVWCQQHLSPPFFFATTTTLPHLPFEDRYFDLVYCGSVFTHIADLPDATLLELRRILRPGGLVYATVHDEHSVRALFEQFRERGLTELLHKIDEETGVLEEGYAFFCIGTEPWTQVFYESSYLAEKWSRFMDIVSVNPQAMDYQTALLLRKPA